MTDERTQKYISSLEEQWQGQGKMTEKSTARGGIKIRLICLFHQRLFRKTAQIPFVSGQGLSLNFETCLFTPARRPGHDGRGSG
jgi:hypothetical protein